jgi:hypothetical protein
VGGGLEITLRILIHYLATGYLYCMLHSDEHKVVSK